MLLFSILCRCIQDHVARYLQCFEIAPQYHPRVFLLNSGLGRQAEMAAPKKHILVLTPPGSGHAGPTLELARKISEHVSVTFVTSQYLIEDLQKKQELVPSAKQDLMFYGIDDGTKPDGDDPKAMRLMFKIHPLMTKLAEEISYTGSPRLEADCPIRPIDAVLADHFLAASFESCFKRNIPVYFFNTPSIGFLRFIMSLSEDAPVIPMEGALGFLRLPKPGEVQPMTEIGKKLFLPSRKLLPLAKGILENSFLSVDKEQLEMIRSDPEIGNVPLYFVGPLFPPQENASAQMNSTDTAVHEWLNGQRTRSVIYVSFGSSAVPSDEQIPEIAKALLQLNQPFIWSLKEKGQKNLPEEVLLKMGKQFEPGSRFLILPWAPQVAILAHPSTAIIISHCGWNGTLESLAAGVPVVAWPMFAEQLINAEWLVKHGVAILIPGTGKNGRIVPAQEIVEALLEVAGFFSANNSTKYLEAAQFWAAETKMALSLEGSSTKDLLRFVASL